MLSNLGKALRRGFNRIKTPASGVFDFARTAYGYLGVVKLAKKLPGFAVNQKVLCTAQVPVLHNHQECKYVSSKCHEVGLEIVGEHLLYRGKRYPISPLVGSGGGEVLDVKGNKLFAINTAGENHYLDFESELEENKVLVVAYDGAKCVDPVVGKRNRHVVANFRCEVYPFSFSVVNYETKEVNILLSLLMLPFNMSGLIIGCAGRLSAGLLSAVANGLNWLADSISDKVDKKIIHQHSGVLVGKENTVFSSLLIFTLSALSSLFSIASSLVMGSANFTESIIRLPSGLVNGMYNCNMKCVPVRANAVAIVDSLKSMAEDVGTSCMSFSKSFLLCKARLCGDAEYLKTNLGSESGFVVQESEHLEHDNGGQGKKKKISHSDLKEIGSIGRDLSAQVLYGTSDDISTEKSKQRKAPSFSKGL